MSVVSNPARTQHTGTVKYEKMSDQVVNQLVLAWQNHGDLAARNQLIVAFRPFILARARQVSRLPNSLKIEELEASGIEGFIAAIDRFDPTRGYKLVTFAWAHVYERMQRYSRHSTPGVTRPVKRLMENDPYSGNLRHAVSLYHKTDDGEESELDIIDSNTVDVVQEMAISDAASSAVHIAQHILSKRELHIITHRVFAEDPQTMEELGKHWGISKERIRQLEKKAIEKIRKALKQRGIDRSILA